MQAIPPTIGIPITYKAIRTSQKDFRTQEFKGGHKWIQLHTISAQSRSRYGYSSKVDVYSEYGRLALTSVEEIDPRDISVTIKHSRIVLRIRGKIVQSVFHDRGEDVHEEWTYHSAELFPDQVARKLFSELGD